MQYSLGKLRTGVAGRVLGALYKESDEGRCDVLLSQTTPCVVTLTRIEATG